MIKKLFRMLKLEGQEEGVLDQLDDEEIEDMLGAESSERKMADFVTSDIFVKECRKLYAERVQAKLVDKDLYKLVDALEEVRAFLPAPRNLSTAAGDLAWQRRK